MVLVDHVRLMVFQQFALAYGFSGVVKGGTIVRSTYDKDDNCEIVYQIERKGLRSSVEGGATK